MKLFWPVQQDFKRALNELTLQPVNTPFSEDIYAFTQALSKRFLKLRHLPEVVALGYWLRNANVKKMQEQFMKQNVETIVKARGTVFHIAPSNVDTIFVYSWILSLMAGNRNILRISSKAEVNEMMQIILDELENHDRIAKQTIICTYEHTENATADISARCHTRVIWGGDQTIQAVRHVPLSPLANELTFADRFSLAILDAKRIEKLQDEELDKLLEQFYNDSFWFNQLACSSPRLIVWIGEKTERFWQAFEKKIKQKNYELLAATQVIKYTTALQLATENYVETVAVKPYFTRITMEDVPANARELHCGSGLFYEYELQNLIDVAQIILDKDQTLVYYGFTINQLQELARAVESRGIDRIVPIGQALDFDEVWDGQNFLTSFTRKISIKY